MRTHPHPLHGLLLDAGRPRRRPVRRSTIRVLLADCYPEISRTFEIIFGLAPDLELLGAASSVEEAVDKARILRPDVVTTCGLLPGGGGIEAIRGIRRLVPATPVLVVSTIQSPEFAERARQEGACGYVLKPFYPHVLIDAVRRASRGARFFRM